MKQTLGIGIGTWILLFALFLPFSYSFFPTIGIELTNSLAPLCEWISSDLFGNAIYAAPSTSDSGAQFAQALLLLIFALIFGLLLRKQTRFSPDQVRAFLHTAAAYILSFFLLKYGLDKLFQFQFYAPEPNTLHTPLGMLSKDILFWSSMGTSSSYNTFMGLIEVIPAVLLLASRTRMLGAFIALGVLVNVLMINFSFDITVKLLSIYLVIVALFVLSPWFKQLYAFFISHSDTTEIARTRLEWTPKIRLIAKSIVVVLIITEGLFPYIKSGEFNGRKREKIAHFGSYEIQDWKPEILGYKNLRRIHIHSKGYLILEDKNGNFVDFPIRIAPDNSIVVQKESTQIHVDKEGSKVDFYVFKAGEVDEILSTKKIRIDALPARDDSFHWTVDGMVR